MQIYQMWPAPLAEWLGRYYGQPVSTKLLGGQSRAVVWRITFRQRHLIIKSSPNPAEFNFYRKIAPLPIFSNITIPQLYFALEYREQYWLVLEDVPNSLPRSRWLADPAVLQTLRRLHSLSADALTLSAFFQPQWTLEMNWQAARLSKLADSALSNLEILRERYAYLLEPLAWISGDPNPTNWGLNSDGQPVLFDWERFGRGHPALDVAISAPGLPTWGAFAQLAAVYHQTAEPPAEFVLELAVAKLWSVIEYLHSYATNQMKASIRMQPEFLQLIQNWLREIIPVLLK